MSPGENLEFESQFARIEELVQAIELSPDTAMKVNAQDLVRAVLDLHAAGFARMLGRLGKAGPDAQAAVVDLADDPLVASLLSLHGLHPHSLEERVEQALDSVRPYLKSHGGEVTLVSVDDGVVRLRLQGSCHGCPSSSATLQGRIEQAIIAAAPDAAAIEVDGVTAPPPSAVIGIEPLRTGHASAAATRTPSIPAGAPQ